MPSNAKKAGKSGGRKADALARIVDGLTGAYADFVRAQIPQQAPSPAPMPAPPPPMAQPAPMPMMDMGMPTAPMPMVGPGPVPPVPMPMAPPPVAPMAGLNPYLALLLGGRV